MAQSALVLAMLPAVNLLALPALQVTDQLEAIGRGLGLTESYIQVVGGNLGLLLAALPESPSGAMPERVGHLLYGLLHPQGLASRELN